MPVGTSHSYNHRFQELKLCYIFAKRPDYHVFRPKQDIFVYYICKTTAGQLLMITLSQPLLMALFGHSFSVFQTLVQVLPENGYIVNTVFLVEEKYVLNRHIRSQKEI